MTSATSDTPSPSPSYPSPAAEAGLLAGCENASDFIFSNIDMRPKFLRATELLRQPFARVLRELLPDAIVSDFFLPWTQDVAAEIAVPRHVFHGTSLFSLCASHSSDCFKLLEYVQPGSAEFFVLPGLPHQIEMQRSQVRDFSKIPERAFEASNQAFILVVMGVRGNDLDCLPEGFEEEVVERGKGLVIRGWAPQILILNHKAVGGFVTHCGWNSCLEGVSAGVPMITWPLFAEQFFNERLIVDVLKVGVGVGVKEYANLGEERSVVTGEEVRRVVCRVMDGGEEAKEMRRRARELAEMARRAVEEGGSSYVDMGELIQELIERRKAAGTGYMGSNF